MLFELGKILDFGEYENYGKATALAFGYIDIALLMINLHTKLFIERWIHTYI